MEMAKVRKKIKARNQEKDVLVTQYQAGDESAGIQLLKEYGYDPEKDKTYKLIGMYYDIIRYGKFDFENKQSRQFIALFFPKEIGAQIRKPYQYLEIKEMVVKKISQIQWMMQSVPDEDLIQEMIMIILTQAKRYEYKKRSFSTYIYSTFKFRVSDYVLSIMKSEDAMLNKDVEICGLGEDVLEDESIDFEVEEIPEDVLVMQTEEKLGNSWVRGLNCGDEFKELTPLQRMILKLNYEERQSDREISEKMGMHINTIFRHRKKAREVIVKTLEGA